MEPTAVLDRPTNPIDAEEELANWLAVQTWSTFAVSLAERYFRFGRLSDAQWSAARAMRTKIEASRLAKAAVAVATTVRAEPVTAGFYLVGEVAMKVTMSKAGRLYAQPLNPASGKFEYQPGAIFEVEASGVRMTLDDARRYGQVTGRCVVCGALLTVAKSVDAGIGPVCAKRFS